MKTSRNPFMLRVALCVLVVGVSAPAGVPAPVPGDSTGAVPESGRVVVPESSEGTPAEIGSTEEVLQQARELVKNRKYDEAIVLLKGSIEQLQPQTERSRAAYLLLISIYVQRANEKSLEEPETERLYRDEARNWTRRCLMTRELRHTAPDPTSLEFPTGMIDLFAKVRTELLGSFRLKSLVPADATVLLDADTLRAFPGETALGDVDIPAGPHLVIVRRDGYKDRTDDIVIPPGTQVTGSYELKKKRGKLWYSSWSTGIAAAAYGVVTLVSGGGGAGEAPQPLPEPPPPPSR